MVWVCGWGVGFVPQMKMGEMCENSEHGMGLWLWWKVCHAVNGENCENGLGLSLGCRVCTPSENFENGENRPLKKVYAPLLQFL